MPLLPSSRPAPAVSRLVGPHARRWPALLLVAVVAAGCGKRGAPLPPLPRVPAAVSEWTALRSDETVALTLVVPGTNVSGDAPGDIAGIEIYAVTADAAPELEAGRVPPGMTLVASAPVRRPLPPLPPSAPADLPPVPREPGLDQGERTTFREQLTPALRVAQPSALPAPAPPAPVVSDAPALSLPVVFATDARQAKRHYVAVAVSRRGTRGAWSAVRSVPVGPVSGAPSAPALTHDAAAVTLTWTAARDARSGPTPATADTLESRPFGPAAVATRYAVYATAPDGTAPVKLTDQPVAALTYAAAGVEFGRERCFLVRGIDTLDGVDVEGPASPVACITPADTFPPPAPSALEAVGGAGVVSLIWEGVDAADLAGYLVFRGVAGGEPTEQLTPEPIRASSFEDRRVTAGTRYVYVVVAVDSATPANRSGPSNRAEETARQ